jgi:hypothetical protein
MKTSLPLTRLTICNALSLVLLTFTGPVRASDEHGLGDLKGSVTLELVGQAVVQSPTAAIQFGYLSRIVGLDQIFTGTPENETTAMFTFFNTTATTRVITTGPLRIVNREGTATFYYNPTAGGSFTAPDSFKAGSPVLTANLTHQVLFDTIQNTFITQFSLTVISASDFLVGHEHVRLGQPGQRATWVVYGRPNTTTTTTTFAIAGFGLTQ